MGFDDPPDLQPLRIGHVRLLDYVDARPDALGGPGGPDDLT